MYLGHDDPMALLGGLLLPLRGCNHTLALSILTVAH